MKKLQSANEKTKKALTPKDFFNFMYAKKLKNIFNEEQVRPNHQFSLIAYCLPLTAYRLNNGCHEAQIAHNPITA